VNFEILTNEVIVTVRLIDAPLLNTGTGPMWSPTRLRITWWKDTVTPWTMVSLQLTGKSFETLDYWSPVALGRAPIWLRDFVNTHALTMISELVL
jgi:hypothetical protein